MKPRDRIRKFNNEKGSVLVLVLVMIAVLSVMGTSVLAAAFSNYKMKIVNSSMKSNLYVAEAGLEEVYGKIYGFVVDGVEEAKKASNLIIEGFDEENIDDIVNILKSNPFKTCYKKDSADQEISNLDELVDYPQVIQIGTDRATAEFEFNREWIANNPEEIEGKINAAFSYAFKEKFLLKLQQDGVFIDSTLDANKKRVKSEYNPGVEPIIITATREDDGSILDDVIMDSTDNDVVAGINKTKIDDFFFSNPAKDKMTIKITSEYKDKMTKRVTDVDLVVKVPKYNEPYEVEVLKKEFQKHPLWEQAIATDGKFVAGNATVGGKVFALGGVDTDGNLTVSDRTVVGESANINIKGGSTFNFGSMYARNVLLEKSGITFNGSTGSEYYIKDDFEMNNTNQKVTLNGDYYGFSDGSKSNGNNPDESSGIIINSDDIATNSKFTLNGDLNINGTSYVKVNPVYQTGESLSIKGNYLAYTMPLPSGNYAENKMNFEYIAPLMLPTSFANGAQFGLNDRIKYFMEYYNLAKANPGSYSPLTTGNVIVNGRVQTMGSAVTGNNVIVNGSGANISPEIARKYQDAQNKYENIVRYLGDNGGNNTHIKVNNDVNFGLGIVTNDGASVDLKTMDANGFQYTSANVTLNSNAINKAFIITSGSVNITGNGTISGCIIAQNGITMSGGAKVNYSEAVVLKAFDTYRNVDDIFKKVPRNYPKKAYNSKSVVKPDPDGGTNIEYTGVLDFENWKIKYD